METDVRAFAAPETEHALGYTFRPDRLDEFVGQDELKVGLAVAIEAARRRGETIDHMLFSGPPGLGKTTLAQIVAQEMGCGFHATTAPALARPGDLVALLTGIAPSSVLFVDEIHRLPKLLADYLLTAMEDRHIDLLISDGANGRSVRLPLEPFTLIGATTRPGMLTGPLRDRFGHAFRLDYYAVADLERVLARDAGLLGLDFETAALTRIARCARGTPRVAKKLLRRVRDHALVEGSGKLDAAAVDRTFAVLGIDERGLDRLDRAYLDTIARNHRGGPVGVETLAAAVAEDRDTLEDAVEPYLLQLGLIARTPRGRVLTPSGYAAIGWGATPRRAVGSSSRAP